MSGETNRRTNHGDGYSDCWLCGLFGGVGMKGIIKFNGKLYQPLEEGSYTIQGKVIEVDESKYQRMWKRVKQIRADGCLLTSEDLDEIEKQDLKDNKENHITT